MKKILICLLLSLFLLLSGCQAAGTAADTGTLLVNVTWQTDAWKPGASGILTLPDTQVDVYKIFSTQVFHTGVTDLLGTYQDNTLPVGWYWVKAMHQPEGVKKSDYGKHWVAHFVHIQTDQTTELNFDFNNAGGWTFY